MAAETDAQAKNSAAQAGTLVGAPDQSTFGAKETADETRQAQHQAANDVPVDVNPNAIVARTQASVFIAQQNTLARMADNFEAGAARRNGLFDHMAAKLAGVGS